MLYFYNVFLINNIILINNINNNNLFYIVDIYSFFQSIKGDKYLVSP